MKISLQFNVRLFLEKRHEKATEHQHISNAKKKRARKRGREEGERERERKKARDCDVKRANERKWSAYNCISNLNS